MTGQEKYKRTRKGLSAKIYAQQRASSIERGHPYPEYNLEGFRIWFFSQNNFENLYTNWVNSNYKKEMIPSVDRIVDSKPYTFKNIRLTTWQDNQQKQFDSNSVPITQLDLKGNIISEYQSISEASEKLGINRGHIHNCCTGKQKTARKSLWVFTKIH